MLVPLFDMRPMSISKIAPASDTIKYLFYHLVNVNVTNFVPQASVPKLEAEARFQARTLRRGAWGTLVWFAITAFHF